MGAREDEGWPTPGIRMVGVGGWADDLDVFGEFKLVFPLFLFFLFAFMNVSSLKKAK